MNIPILIDDDIVRFSTNHLELPTKYIKIERDHQLGLEEKNVPILHN